MGSGPGPAEGKPVVSERCAKHGLALNAARECLRCVTEDNDQLAAFRSRPRSPGTAIAVGVAILMVVLVAGLVLLDHCRSGVSSGVRRSVEALPD